MVHRQEGSHRCSKRNSPSPQLCEVLHLRKYAIETSFHRSVDRSAPSYLVDWAHQSELQRGTLIIIRTNKYTATVTATTKIGRIRSFKKMGPKFIVIRYTLNVYKVKLGFI